MTYFNERNYMKLFGEIKEIQPEASGYESMMTIEFERFLGEIDCYVVVHKEIHSSSPQSVCIHNDDEGYSNFEIGKKYVFNVEAFFVMGYELVDCEHKIEKLPKWE